MSNINIRFGQFDPEAKADATMMTNNYKPWSNMADLKNDTAHVGNYTSGEHNHDILDGSMEEFPDNTSGKYWGLWTNSKSDENALFSVFPQLDISFSANHKSKGLTLYFYPYTDDYASVVHVTWYDGGDNILAEGDYYFTSNIGIIIKAVTDFRRIMIQFLSTNIPLRYVKLYGIDFGITRVFDDKMINSAKILEEIDPISNEIRINTLDFQIKTHNPEFSLVSGNPDDDMLIKKQMLTITCNNAPYGVFFLDSWEDENNVGNTFPFKAKDAVGVMEQYKFMGGIYNDAPIKTLLDEIFSVCFPTGLIGYELDVELSGITLNGYLPICSCREALRRICFAISAVADTSRRKFVYIYPRDKEKTYDIPRTKKYRGGSNKPTEYYSGVDVAAYSYTASTETAQAFNGVLPAGTQPIQFSEPLSNLTITGGTIVQSGVNYAMINSAGGVVTVTGRKYTVNKSIYSARAEVIAGEVENVLPFENCTLVTPQNALSLAQNILEYTQQKVKFIEDMRLENREVGYIARLETYGRSIIGTIESLGIDLRAGKAKVRVIGNVETTDN